MRIDLFYHSLRSDWNNGNAHFLRGVVRELLRRGHRVQVHEPAAGWSASKLREHEGALALAAYHERYPELSSSPYPDGGPRDLAALLEASDLVLVHEWTDPDLLARIAALRARGAGFRLLFHDTHHRVISAPQEMAALPLERFDGVLAFGEVLRQAYLERSWHDRVWTWHEAADTTVFRPSASPEAPADLVWIGNWGAAERAAELQRFLIDPLRRLDLRTTLHGVRWPESALRRLSARTTWGGYLPNHRVPEVFARHRFTVHVPRRFYVERLIGIPTIRPFEALACGIPLISAPWQDSEGLFSPGHDHLSVADGEEMVEAMRLLLADPGLRRTLSSNGLRTIRERHTVAHRVDQLLDILDDLGLDVRPGLREEMA